MYLSINTRDWARSASTEFLLFCEIVSPNGEKAAKKFGLEKHYRPSGLRNPIFKLPYSGNVKFLTQEAQQTLKYIIDMRDYLLQLTRLPLFLDGPSAIKH